MIINSKQAKNIVLVPNSEVLQQQLARILGSLENEGVQVAPAVFIFSSWVQFFAVRLRMLEGSELPRSLDAWTSLMLWAKSAQGKFEHTGHAFDLAAARQARDADRLLRQWAVDKEKLWLEDRFFAMRAATGRALESQLLFSAEDWIDDFTERLLNGESMPVSLPESIDLVGFIELTRQESRLLDALERHGVRINRPGPSGDHSRVRVFRYETPEDEWQAAALWAKGKLDEGARRLAIVMPGELTASGSHSRRIRQLFSAIFHPGESARLADDSIQDFFIPGADSLAERGVIKDALFLLQITLAGADEPLEFTQLSRLLLSTHYPGFSDEHTARAGLELRLRDAGIYRHSLRDLQRLAYKSGLEDALPVLCEKISELPAKQTLADMGGYFHEILSHWGWPGDGMPASGPEVDELIGLLEQLSTLPTESSVQSLETLELMVAGTRLSVGGGPFSPVQILTPEVAVAGGYEGVWVCNMDEANWPPPVSGNPFVPAVLRPGIPRMNPEGQHDYFKALTGQLRIAAKDVCISWSRDGGQGPRNASGLIADLNSEGVESTPPVSVASSFWSQDGVDQHCGDSLSLVPGEEDSHGMPMPDGDAVKLPGGSGYFRLQAACPMLGYMRYRLAADFPAVPSALASPQFRGELLHQALRELYRPVTHSGGKPSSGDVPSSVEAALIRLGGRDRLTPSGFRAERGRLARLLREWLLLDNERDGFAVEAVEETRRLSSGLCEINIRFDRLDRLSDQRFFVLDYKSGGGGKSRALKWVLPRLQEPQLPLYAVLLEDEGSAGKAGGLSFAMVSPGKCGYDGISDDTDLPPTRGIRKAGGSGRGGLRDWDWPSLMGHWRAQIEMLREEILSGRAENIIYDEDIVEQSRLDLILRHSAARLTDVNRENDQDAG